MERTEFDALIFHVAFLFVASAALLAPVDALDLGLRILALVMLYNVSLPLVARWRGHDAWLRIWAFVLPISILQIVPDWFLADVVGSLEFPVSGPISIGAVPLYMALMWSIPLFLIVLSGERALKRGAGRGYVVAIVVGLVLFAGAERLLPMLEIWVPVDVKLALGVAVYILPAEAVLSGVTFAGWRYARDRGAMAQLLVAFIVMFTYLGAASTFYLLVEVA